MNRNRRVKRGVERGVVCIGGPAREGVAAAEAESSDGEYDDDAPLALPDAAPRGLGGRAAGLSTSTSTSTHSLTHSPRLFARLQRGARLDETRRALRMVGRI